LTVTLARAAGVPFQIGISQSNPRVARDRAARVRALGASALQFTLPDWWPPGDDEVMRLAGGLATVADGTPLVLYNPPHAKRRLTLPEIAALRASVPALVGAKLPCPGTRSPRVTPQALPGAVPTSPASARRTR